MTGCVLAQVVKKSAVRDMSLATMGLFRLPQMESSTKRLDPGGVLFCRFVPVTGGLPQSGAQTIGEIGDIELRVGSPPNEEASLTNECVNAPGARTGLGLRCRVFGIALSVSTIFGVKIERFRRGALRRGLLLVFVMAFKAEQQLVEPARREVSCFEARCFGPTDTGRLGREGADAALGKDGTRIVHERVDERALADPRVTDETDGAFSAELSLQRFDALQIAIEVV